MNTNAPLLERKRAYWTVAALLGIMLIIMGVARGRADTDDSWNMALALDIPGKNGWTTCEPFATELYNRMTRAGGEAYLIIFDWEDANHIRNSHAMVVYRDAGGRYWGMDQRSPKPVWLGGRNPGQWVKDFFPRAMVKVRMTYTDPANFGQYPDLSRAPQLVAYVAFDGLGRRLAMR